ncbi:Hint domain-containing protein [Tropicimonas sp. TH_r6]|uniref:Hint domain-containing protein n=1 Tax=Tropicimonas sp. TH_r6 TaxID=3082085 RepID=UPI0029549006|nr:Hint domain-containing protein [Tropicimonas sp. TH_r6]MDV7145015.1 Hint domain-containing protein [Tropicimonas sp. TH_r6]
MGTGVTGTFVIRWTQIILDDLPGGDPEDLRPGATWRWTGRAMRVDGPDGIARLGAGVEAQELHRRAARKARQLCGQVMHMPDRDMLELEEDQLLDRGFLLTDGRRAFAASIIETDTGRDRLVAFLGDLPPGDTDLWVARVTTTSRAEARARMAPTGGVICFAAGTPIATPKGRVSVEALQPGDLVETRDDGPQPILWVGSRKISGARLHLEPHLRPIRIVADAFGAARPEPDLLVSRGHRLLMAGRGPRALFAEREVLVRAEDLLGRPGVSEDLDVTQVTYVHLMLDRHQVLTAAGMPCESFHPDEADLFALAPTDRAVLERQHPSVFIDPAAYGPPVRRRLGLGEAAILSASPN